MIEREVCACIVKTSNVVLDVCVCVCNYNDFLIQGIVDQVKFVGQNWAEV